MDLYSNPPLQILHFFQYDVPAKCIISPNVALIQERIQTHIILQALSISSFIHYGRKHLQTYLRPIPGRTMYLGLGVVVSMFDFHRIDRGLNPSHGGKISCL